MPPIKLLRGDRQFYGEIKPPGTSNQDQLAKPAPPPDVNSNVPLATETQRENFGTENIKDPYSREQRKGESIELEKVGIEELKEKTDLGSRFVSFLQTPIVSTSTEAQKAQSERETARITGDESYAPVKSEIRPVGEVPAEVGNRVMNFIEKEFMKVVLVIGGVYLAGQFLEGIGKNLGNKKSDYKVSE